MSAITDETMTVNPASTVHEMKAKETSPESGRTDDSRNPSDKNDSAEQSPSSTLVVRSVFGGILMGLANLVPGISGGTMLLAAGIYPKFIESVAEVTRLKFKFHSLLVLGCVVLSAVVAIGLLAGVLKDLVVEHRWVMYSLFIGLTLGGVPVVWNLAKKASTSLVAGGISAFAAMVGLALLQAYGVMGGGSSNFVTLFVAGLAGASAMILPGLSGGYLLLLLGQYVPILTAIENFKGALEARDISAAMEPALTVVLPVGIGVVTGVAVVGNLLQWLFKRYRQVTLGILLGLLLGSVVGLWPFQQTLQPEIGDTINKTGQVVTAENIEDFDPEDWNTEYFSPGAGQIAGSLGLIILGFGVTLGVAMIGGGKDETDQPSI